HGNYWQTLPHWRSPRISLQKREKRSVSSRRKPQYYGEWEQIQPPRLAASHANPTQQLDFKRFSSDALRDYLRAEREILRRITPEIPATTNFMVMGETKAMNYPDWAAEIDFVSNDHYAHPGPQRLDELSFSAGLTHSIAEGRPWFLMEHSTSAVNWQTVNLAKSRGELARDSLVHVAHGADAVCFFQWRQSAAGAEKYHSAMVPHAGPDSELFRAVAALGRTLEGLTPVTGSVREPARAALVYDWESWWAVERDSQPTSLLRYRQEALDWYSAFLALGVRVDVVTTTTDLTGYDFVAAPILHVVPRALAARLDAYVHGGGHLATTYYSGVVDENDHVYLGGYPGALRELLGIRVEEFAPLLEDVDVRLDNGLTGTLWTDHITVADAEVEVLARYETGDHAGRPAITRRDLADGGSAAYVSTRLGTDGLPEVLKDLLAGAGVSSELPESARGLVELTVRTDGSESYWFLVNRTDEPVTFDAVAGEALTGPAPDADGGMVLPPRDVAVLRVASGTTPFH
ncbi:beta-galactosidase, partial [Streptomyces clavifer]